MSIPEKLEHYLEHRIPYVIETHDESPHPEETPGGKCEECEALAKPVLVSINGKIAMAVIPAMENVDLRRLGRCLGAKTVRLASETESRLIFPDCDEGEMPIFGSAYGIPVLVPHEITDNEEISFHAGTPHDIVRVRVRDFLVMEKPYVCPRSTILAKLS